MTLRPSGRCPAHCMQYLHPLASCPPVRASSRINNSTSLHAIREGERRGPLPKTASASRACGKHLKAMWQVARSLDHIVVVACPGAAGADVAIAAADIALFTNDLRCLLHVIRLGRLVRVKVAQNVALAVATKVWGP